MLGHTCFAMKLIIMIKFQSGTILESALNTSIADQ